MRCGYYPVNLEVSLNVENCDQMSYYKLLKEDRALWCLSVVLKTSLW